METNNLTRIGLVLLIFLSSISLLPAQSTPNVECNLRGGAGLATPTSGFLSPVVANASMVVDGWISNNWKLGVEVSYMQLELKNRQPSLLSKEHLLNQFFVGPSIAISSLRSNQSSWSAQGALSIGYTLLSRNKAKEGVELTGDYEAFNKMQHGFGMNLSAEMRKSIGHYYVGIGGVYSSRMIQVGAKNHLSSSFVSIFIPQLVFGMVW